MATKKDVHVLQHEDIEKAENDDRSYRSLVLINKMKVLLISDEMCRKASVALDVNIGHLSDPNDLPGLAHLCQQTLIMGTQTYPKYNQFQDFLLHHDGSFTAKTSSDHTTYYFDIHVDHFQKALEQFVNFFIAPLFKQEWIEKAVEIIDSKYKQELEDDNFRFDYFNKSIAKFEHPYSRFAVGNKETLSTIPQKLGINVRTRLLDFFNKYYSANIMSLCITSNETLYSIEKMVVDIFCQVRNMKVVPMRYEDPFKDLFHTKWYIVPIGNIRTLYITFSLPEKRLDHWSTVLRFISIVLEYDGKESLLSTLRAKNWCYSLKTDCQETESINFFRITAELTENGLLYIDNIIALLFDYINMFKERNQSTDASMQIRNLYKKYLYIDESEKTYFDDKKFMKMAQTLCYPMNKTVYKENINDVEWDIVQDTMDWILNNHISPKTIRVHVLAKKYENIAHDTSIKWSNTKYKEEKIPKEIINMWKNPPHFKLNLPIVNKFMSTYDTKPHKLKVEEYPKIIENTPFTRLWYKQEIDNCDISYAKTFFHFVSPHASNNLIDSLLNDRFAHLLQYTLYWDEYTSLYKEQWYISATRYGILLQICGHNQQQLLEKILSIMLHLEIELKTFDIEMVKNDCLDTFNKFKQAEPSERAFYHLSHLLSEKFWMVNDILAAIEHLTINGMLEYIQKFFSKIHVECLIHGNVTIEEALNTIRYVQYELEDANYLNNVQACTRMELLPDHHEIKLQPGSHFLFEEENYNYKFSCVQVYYQIGKQSTMNNILLDLLHHIIRKRCSLILEVLEKLGTIFVDVRRSNGTQGLIVTVESRKCVQYIQCRIKAFMNSTLNYIHNMSETEFLKHKETLMKSRFPTKIEMNDLSDAFWKEISSQRYNFDQIYTKRDNLEIITLKELVYFYMEMIHKKTPKLSILVKSGYHSCEENKDIQRKESQSRVDETDKFVNMQNVKKKIDDIKVFKQNQDIYVRLGSPEFPRKGKKTFMIQGN